MIAHSDTNSLLEAVRRYAVEDLDFKDLTEAEDKIQEIVRTLGGAMMSEIAAKMSRKPTYRGVRIICRCGGRAEFKGYRSRWIKTLHGEVEVERARYRCNSCGSNYTPWDEEQGLSKRVWTPRVKELVASTCAALPYKASSELIKRTTGLVIEESSAEDIVRDVGEQLRLEEHKTIVSAIDEGAGLECEAALSRMYISIDAGKAHTDGEWHDIKAAVIYGGERAEGKDVDAVVSPRYIAAQESSEEFGRRVYTRAVQLGYTGAKERVVIADGAEWIWNEARNHFGESIKIIDYWHASEHIHKLAQALYGEGDPKGRRWAREHCERLKDKGPDSLLRAIRRRKAKEDRQREALRLEQGYFRKYRKYMNYPLYRSKGMMIGSGPVESACKVVIGQRLKQSGMRWTKDGADVVLATRTALLSNEFDRIERACRAA